MAVEGLREVRDEVERWLSDRGLESTVSASRHSLHRQVTQAIQSYAHGEALEAGAGHSPYAAALEAHCNKVTRLDVDESRGQIDVVGDIQNMAMLEDGSFDTVLCTQVLEHVPSPSDAVEEMARVLRPGGVLILSAPHLSMLHEAPTDYFRFTSFGLRSLVGQAGLEEASITPTAGLVAFMGHTISLALWTSLGRLRVLRWAVWAANRALSSALTLVDRLVGMRSHFAVDHVLVAHKPFI